MRKFFSFSLFLDLYYRLFHNSAVNLNYFWNFGILAMLCLLIQIITGLFLAMHYTPDMNLSFFSIEYIMRDVNYGWFLRYMHLNCASMFFIVVYLHMFRGIYYGSYFYPRELVWFIGVIILFLMIITGFLGYVLPWGQMSFWAATVITNLVSAVPIFGSDLVILLWGGYSLCNATLGKFFSLHFFLPFLILGLVIVHIFFLHEFGSNNPFGLQLGIDDKPFYPYYVIKDINGIYIFFNIFLFFVFFFPNFLGHSDNYILANPLVTPIHIVPEWYFLPFYAILKSIPDKLGGVCCLFLAIIVLLLIPFIWGNIGFQKDSGFMGSIVEYYWIFIVICFLLGWIGGLKVEDPFISLSQYVTILYFMYFLIFMPYLYYLDVKFLKEFSISSRIKIY